jgi:seipin
MYNYRITSFVVFTSLFWLVEMLFAAATWAILTFVLPQSTALVPKYEEEDDFSVKEEERQGTVKKEEEQEGRSLRDIPAAEADDEDDDVPGHSLIGTGNLRISDSGIGTSMESSSSRLDHIRRRQKSREELRADQSFGDG